MSGTHGIVKNDKVTPLLTLWPGKFLVDRFRERLIIVLFDASLHIRAWRGYSHFLDRQKRTQRKDHAGKVKVLDRITLLFFRRMIFRSTTVVGAAALSQFTYCRPVSPPAPPAVDFFKARCQSFLSDCMPCHHEH